MLCSAGKQKRLLVLEVVGAGEGLRVQVIRGAFVSVVGSSRRGTWESSDQSSLLHAATAGWPVWA